MPSELKKPEPVAWLYTAKPGYGMNPILWHSRWLSSYAGLECFDEHALHTAAQLEQYAADRVREALERAAQECDRLTHALDNAGTSYHRPATADRCARAIRTLKEQTK